MNAGLVVVDKPSGMTSHDVVSRCRRIFATRKVGHAGTLDPMATGVLVVGIERATKILGLLTATDKSYAATIRLGQTTTTEDAEGELLQTVSAAKITGADIEAAVAALRGEISQIPSAVSAIKVGGKRAYQLARDVGAALGVGGHLTALRRTRVGRFGLDEARTLDTLAENPGLSYSLDEACLLAFPRLGLTAEEAEHTRHGRPLKPAGIEGVYAATAPDGHVIALLKDEAQRTKSVVVLRPATLSV